jgi:hypothetical protein
MKNILDKINKADEIQASKVELGKHEVELANINDFNNLATSADNLLKKLNESYSALEKTIQPILANGNQFLSVMEQASNLNIELDRKFKEIGMDWKSTPEAKKFRDVISKSREVNTIIARVKNL